MPTMDMDMDMLLMPSLAMVFNRLTQVVHLSNMCLVDMDMDMESNLYLLMTIDNTNKYLNNFFFK